MKIIALNDCRMGAGTFASVGPFELAVFRLAEPQRIVVIENACPHSSGNLSAGSVEANVVTCPVHEWRFDLDRGVCVHSDLARVQRYPAEVRDGLVWADLPGRLPV